MINFVKWLAPLIFTYLQEIVMAKDSGENKTTTLERISVLVNVILLVMLAFVGEKAFLIHDAKVTAEAKVETLEGKLTDCKNSKSKHEEHVLTKCPTPQPKVTYDAAPKAAPPRPKPKVTESAQKDISRMLREINES